MSKVSCSIDMASRKAKSQTSMGREQQVAINSNQQALTDEPAWEAESATVISEVVEELTEEELEDQQRLELKVERSFTGAAMHCWNCETGACTAVHIEPLKHIVRIDLLWDGITPID